MDGQHILRPGQTNGIKILSLCGEAYILSGVIDPIVFGKIACLVHLGRAFAIRRPGCRAINGFAIDIQPLADTKQQLFGLLGDHPIWPWADIQKQRAIFTNIVDQVMDERVYRFIACLFQISPSVTIIHCSVSDPIVVGKVFEAP